MQLKSILLLLSTALVVPAQEACCATPTWLLEAARSEDVACDISKIATATYQHIEEEWHEIHAVEKLFRSEGAVTAPAYARAEAIGNSRTDICQASVFPSDVGQQVKQSQGIGKAFREFVEAEQAYDTAKLAHSAAAETSKKICTEEEMGPLQDLMAWREQQKTRIKSSTASQVGQRAANALTEPTSTENLTAAPTSAFANWLPGWWCEMQERLMRKLAIDVAESIATAHCLARVNENPATNNILKPQLSSGQTDNRCKAPNSYQAPIVMLQRFLFCVVAILVATALTAKCIHSTWAQGVTQSKEVACYAIMAAIGKFDQIGDEWDDPRAPYPIFWQKGTVKAPASARADAISPRCCGAMSEVQRNTTALSSVTLDTLEELVEIMDLEHHCLPDSVTESDPGKGVEIGREITEAFGKCIAYEKKYKEAMLAYATSVERAKEICKEEEMAPLEELSVWLRAVEQQAYQTSTQQQK
ncbi:hypothetical protein LTR37_015042 [Vermiconidia calcicola]|uniref:Uncharacterized protein n=1 Tax=Vermiconidia calcicola TaxID=1690605 RepID=A0ACC3MS61_9PEZI|nr:hypothetical protein LTR37_015042 [Vermiconidia calcicola]